MDVAEFGPLAPEQRVELEGVGEVLVEQPEGSAAMPQWTMWRALHDDRAAWPDGPGWGPTVRVHRSPRGWDPLARTGGTEVLGKRNGRFRAREGAPSRVRAGACVAPTLAPIFAVLLATHHPLTAFYTGLATALGAGVSMAFSEGLSDTGDVTG